MNPLTRSDLVELEAYAELRDDYRRRVIAHKRSRRMSVGDRVTLLFEDRETLRFQVLEMLFVERILATEKIQDELDVYNELMPGDRELSATLFVEITDAAQIRPELDRLIGIDEHVHLSLGEGPDRETVRARFDTKQLEEDRLSAVQYIRFSLDPTQARRFADAETAVAIEIDHPGYTRTQPLPAPVRDSLARGLTAAPAPLLAVDGAPRPPDDEVLSLSDRVRVRRPGRATLPGQVIVETHSPAVPLLEADAALWQEIVAAARRVAGELASRHGRARLVADFGDTGDTRLHLVPRDDEPH